MDKKQRKSDIGMMSIVAAMVKQCLEKPGVVAIGSPERNTPSVHMMPKTFLEYFGDDTEFEYSENPNYRIMSTVVNGVTFYALFDKYDTIKDGRLYL